MESSVTRLLVATKMLLESLTHWSLGQQTESQVSEIYVRLGNDFNAALAAFAGYGIDMSDMFSVPSDLRSCLETCLSEPASPAALEQHLPRIREIIIRLLQGLKAKQASYKQLLLEQRSHPVQGVTGPRAPAPRQESRVEAVRSPPDASRIGPRPIGAPLPFLGKRAAPQEAAQSMRAPSRDVHASVPPSYATEPEPYVPAEKTAAPEPVAAAEPEVLPKPAADAPTALAVPPVASDAPDAPPIEAPQFASAPLPRADTGDPDDVNLRALRSRDALERRASKRFSAYTFNKMGVSSGLLSGAGTQLGSSPRSSLENRTSFVRHTPHGSLSNANELRPASMISDTPDDSIASAASGPPEALEAPAVPVPVPERAPARALPTIAASPQEPVSPDWGRVADALPEGEAPAPQETSLDLFLQLGRQTRKVTVAVDLGAPSRGLTVARLRMLFVDQFAYSPGMDDFPEIYIKDPQSGVQYQLEDLDDVQARSLLTLNIEPLDQVKQHLDLSMTSVTRELRELKQLLREQHETQAEAPRAEHKGTPIADAAFRAAGQRMSSYVATPHADTGSFPARDASSAGQHFSEELKTQYEALQKLRGDFAILRQVHGDAEQDMRTLFADIRGQVKEMEQVTSLGPSAGRNLIESGKTKLDGHSQEVLTTVEDLQDLIEDLKLDVSHRGVKPKTGEMNRLTTEIANATQKLDGLEQYIQSVKPSWKKTWETELQNIVDEQEFLNYQEGLLVDLKQDHKALQDVFANIQQVVKLRDVGGADTSDHSVRLQRYVPPPPDEEHEGIGTVMIEVRGQTIDHERRLRAVQAAERSRKAKAGQKDEFASELAGFVDGKALRKTGGHREVERIRQKRDQTTLRTMLSNTNLVETEAQPAEPNAS